MNHYTYQVSWSAEDQEYVGTALEFRSLSHLADTPDAALAGIQALIADVVEDLRENGEPVPEPLADRKYSGQVPFRTTPDLHRRLTMEAASRGVSLNKWMNEKLAV